MKGGARRVLGQCPTGSGKCLVEGTLVLMYDGTTKPVEEILEGDLLMGPDSHPKRVSGLDNGRGPLIEIVPTKGEPWICTPNHVLTLVHTRDGRIIDIPANEYVNRSKNFKHCYKLFKQGWKLSSQNLPLDPWVLGFLIGDGSLKRSVRYTSCDPEVTIEMRKRIGKEYKISQIKSPSRAPIFSINVGGVGWGKNLIREAIKKMKLNVNSTEKFIPDIFLRGSKGQRLRLLAGLLDSDGSLSKNCFEFSSSSKKLAKNVEFLAQSCGLRALRSPKKIKYKGEERVYWRVSISGECQQIPTIITRKSAKKRRQKKDVLRSGFTIREAKEGSWYGFSLNGDRRFLLGDGTVTHNTVTFCDVIASSQRKGKRAFIFVHRKELIEQTCAKLGIFGISPGIVGGGYEPDYKRPVQVISVASWKGRKELLGKPDLLVIDESHRVAAKTWAGVAEYYKDAWQLLFTATPERLDGQGLGPFVDTMIQGPSVSELIELGALSDYQIYSVPPKIDHTKLKKGNGDYTKASVAREIKRCEAWGDIVEHYNKHLSGKRAILFAATIENSILVAEKFNQAGVKAWHLDGNSLPFERKRILDDFRNGRIQVLCNVDLFAEGLDVPGVEGIIMLRPTMSLTIYLQQIGRALRPSPGKEKAIILDHVGNVSIHGLPDEQRAWDLGGKKERLKKEDVEEIEKPEPAVRVCPHCFASQRVRQRNCLYCGGHFNLNAMKVTELNGVLVPVDSKAVKADKEKKKQAGKEEVKRLCREAQTYEDFRKIGEKFGYKKGWARHQVEIYQKYRHRWNNRGESKNKGKEVQNPSQTSFGKSRDT